MQAEINRLLLLTGCRRSEIQKPQWSEVGSDSRTWRQQDRAQARDPEQAAQRIIERQPRTESPYITIRSVPAENRLDPAVGHGQETRGIEEVHHGLRHTFASQAVLNGIPLPVVAKLLGHSTVSMILRYAHVTDHEVAAAADRIGSIIAGMCGTPDA